MKCPPILDPQTPATTNSAAYPTTVATKTLKYHKYHNKKLFCNSLKFQGRIKKAHVKQQDKLTPEQIAQRDRNKQLQDFYNAVSWGDKKYCFEQLNKGKIKQL